MRLPKTPRGPWGSRLERSAVLVAIIGAHALVLLLLARPATPDFPDRSNDEGAVDVRLERPRPPRRATGGPAATSSPLQAPSTTASATLEVQAPAPLGTAPDAATPSAATPSAATPSAATQVAPSRPGLDLVAALRAGGFACAGARNARLTPEERARCQEKLGALALKAPSLPAPIDPAKRAYYDAVAQAYDDRAATATLSPPGAAGMFDPPPSYNNGHGPRVGCSVKFGPNASKAPKGPANALRAGPCFIQPPVGSLTPEVDIRKPY